MACGIDREDTPYGRCVVYGKLVGVRHMWGVRKVRKLEKMQTIKLTKKHAKDLYHKMKLKQNPIYVELREALKKCLDFCPCCGKTK